MAENVYFVAGDGTDTAFPEATPHAVMTDGDDDLIASRTDDIVSTGHGADVVDGGRGADVIGGLIQRDPVSGAPVGTAYGAEAIDTDGEAGDAFAVTGGDLLSGGNGNDLIFVEYDSIADGGSGRDTAVVSLYDMWIPWVANSPPQHFQRSRARRRSARCSDRIADAPGRRAGRARRDAHQHRAISDRVRRRF